VPVGHCLNCGRKLKYREWVDPGPDPASVIGSVFHVEAYCPKGHDPMALDYADVPWLRRGES
jgi:hypothetical protein